jgi:hypothetical protein
MTENNLKSKAVDFAKDKVKDEVKDAVKDKVTEAVTENAGDVLEDVGSSFLPWYISFFWWPIKQILMLISWPVRALFKKKKK